MKATNLPGPLFSLQRGGYSEVTHLGEIILVDSDRIVFSSGDGVGLYPARSCLKPFQFLASQIPVESWDTPTENRYVVALGSISATVDQVAQLKRWYGQTVSDRSDQMVFEPIYPLDEAMRAAMKGKGERPDRFCHSCFSKHRAILESCERMGEPLETYHLKTSRYHQRLLAQLETNLGKKVECDWVPDGCLLPSPVLSLCDLAELYRFLVAAAETTREGRVARVMARFPQWIGGPGRVDTRLMEENPGKVIAKEGADGLLALGLFPSKRFPEGAGLVVKLGSGYLPEMALIAIQPLLESLDLVAKVRIPKGHEVHYHYHPVRGGGERIWNASPVIDERLAVWPGDVPFSRKVSLSTEAGSHMTLSSIETTVHLGTHADGLNHFSKGTGGIDSADLTAYGGVCQVIEVSVTRGGSITPRHLNGREVRAKRVLFKTGSYPNPNHFNEDFVSLSAELMEWLSHRGVILVGIDTPSMDPFSSKDLPAHKASQRFGITLLEGLVLKDVGEGLYDLAAYPLPLKDSDASPVRVVLRCPI